MYICPCITYTLSIYVCVCNIITFVKTLVITLVITPITLFNNPGNAIVRDIDSKDGVVNTISVELNLAGNVKKTKAKLTWLPNDPSQPASTPIPLTFVDFDHLITVPKLLEGQDFKDFITPNSRVETPGIGQAVMAGLKVDQIIQVQRRGFFRVDSVNPLVLFNIPTGKASKMSVAKKQ